MSRANLPAISKVVHFPQTNKNVTNVKVVHMIHMNEPNLKKMFLDFFSKLNFLFDIK